MITPPEFDVYKNAKRDFSNVGVSLWLYIAMQICMSFVFGLIITAIYMVMIVDYTVLNAVSLFFVSFLSGLILVFYMNSTFSKKLKDIKFDFKPVETLDTIGMMLLVNYGIGVIGYLFSKMGLPDTSTDYSFTWNSWYNVFTFLSVAIVAPIFEELIFRGMIYNQMTKYNKMFAIVMTSALFGLLHLNLSQSIPAFFISLVLCYMYEKTQSLSVTILGHATNNFLVSLVGYFNGFIIIVVLLILYGIYSVIKYAKDILDFVHNESWDKELTRTFFKVPSISIYFVFTIFCILFDLIQCIVLA